MKDYSNYYSPVKDKILSDAEIVFDIQLEGNEGRDVIIDNISCRALVYNHLNSLNEFKEERVISCKKDVKISRGSIVNFENEIYIVISDIDDHIVYLKTKMKKTNNYLKFKSDKKTIYEIPVIAEDKTSTFGLEENKIIVLGDTKINITIPSKINGIEYIKRGMRFIFDNNQDKICYIITSMNGVTKKGLLNCTLKEDQFKPEDDKINNIAYNDYSNTSYDLPNNPNTPDVPIPIEKFILDGNDKLYIKKAPQEYKVLHENNSEVTDKTFTFTLERSEKTVDQITDIKVLATIKSNTDISCILEANPIRPGWIKLKAVCNEDNNIVLEKEVYVRFLM